MWIWPYLCLILLTPPTHLPPTPLWLHRIYAHIYVHIYSWPLALCYIFTENAHSPSRQQRVRTLHGRTNTPASARTERHLVSSTSLSPSPVQLARKTQGGSPVLLISIASVHCMQRVINLPLKICKVGARKWRVEKNKQTWWQYVFYVLEAGAPRQIFFFFLWHSMISSMIYLIWMSPCPNDAFEPALKGPIFCNIPFPYLEIPNTQKYI